jgi:hypothetical protein
MRLFTEGMMYRQKYFVQTLVDVCLKQLNFLWVRRYTVFIVQAYQTSQYVMPCGGIFLGNDAAVSQEVLTVKGMSNQPVL